MKKWSLYLLILSVLIITGLYLLGKCSDPYFDLDCPDNYSNRGEQMEDYNKFLDRFLQDNPNATGQDVINERLAFFEKHNCAEAMERYRLSQTGQKSSIQEVREAILKSFHERGFKIVD